MSNEPSREPRSGAATGYATDSHDQVVRQDGSVVGECWTQADAKQIACELNTMLRVNEDLRDIISAEDRELRAICAARDDALAEVRRLRGIIDKATEEAQRVYESDGHACDVLNVLRESHNDIAERRAQGGAE